MQIIPQSFTLDPSTPSGEDILRRIERCGRVCYKSEGKITPDSAPEFVRGIIRRGHESVLEHVSVTAHIVTDRGISHELVRHRLAAYSQESSRYCSYGDGIAVVAPEGLTGEAEAAWRAACLNAEAAYKQLLSLGCSAQTARDVLPTCAKTELMMTADLREWRHFFRLRTSPAAHPKMRALALLGLQTMQSRIPIVFDDIAS